MNDTCRISAYRVMWIFVFFDLPTETQKDKKQYALFRKHLLNDGFVMFQFSIYLRHCASVENMEVHLKRVRSFMPKYGKVGLLTVTDKQFGNMQLFHGQQPEPVKTPGIQLEMF